MLFSDCYYAHWKKWKENLRFKYSSKRLLLFFFTILTLFKFVSKKSIIESITIYLIERILTRH